MTDCAACPRTKIMQLTDSCLPANPHFYAEHGIHGMECFYLPAETRTGQVNPGKGHPGMQWSLHAWRYSKPKWTWFWASCAL